MAYKINNTFGTLLVTLPDGTIDTATTDLTLFGKGYAGFGEKLNENFVKVLENFNNTTAPVNKIQGQLWFDQTNKQINVYTGAKWKPVGSTTNSTTSPTNAVQGDLWFDTANNVMKVYGSGGFVTAASAVNGTANRFKYTATASQTTFTGADDNTNILAYDAGFIDLFLNGIRLVNGTDFTATSGTSIVLTVGAAANDILEIVAYGTFELANFSIGAANDVSLAGITDGQVLVYNSTSSSFQPGNASSAEVYGFNKDASGNLIVTTTDGGNDNISSSTFANFDDVLFAASGFTFSLSNGELIATI